MKPSAKSGWWTCRQGFLKPLWIPSLFRFSSHSLIPGRPLGLLSVTIHELTFPVISCKWSHRACTFKNLDSWTSLVVQRVRLGSSNTGGTGPIPGQGARIPHAAWPKKWKKWNLGSFTWYNSRFTYVAASTSYPFLLDANWCSFLWTYHKFLLLSTYLLVDTCIVCCFWLL